MTTYSSKQIVHEPTVAATCPARPPPQLVKRNEEARLLYEKIRLQVRPLG